MIWALFLHAYIFPQDFTQYFLVFSCMNNPYYAHFPRKNSVRKYWEKGDGLIVDKMHIKTYLHLLTQLCMCAYIHICIILYIQINSILVYVCVNGFLLSITFNEINYFSHEWIFSGASHENTIVKASWTSHEWTLLESGQRTNFILPWNWSSLVLRLHPLSGS